MGNDATIIQPSDSGFEKACFAFDLAPLNPAAACVAESVGEVQQAVRWAKENGLKVATLATGHRAIALPSLEDSLLLRPMINEEPVVETGERIVRVGAGTTWDPVVTAVGEAGLAAMHGSSPTVGVIGYTLGGGLSFYGREHGLACNNVRAIEVVTADGEVARIDAENEPDLFWALRGAGGWSAVVTAIELDLLPYPEIFGGATFWPVEAAEAVLSTWLDWTRTAPRSATTSFRIMNLPPMEEAPAPIRGKSVVVVDGIASDKGDGEALYAQLQGLAEPVMEQWGSMPAAAAARLHGDPEDPIPAIGCCALVDDLDDQSVDSLIGAAGADSGSTLIAAELRQLGGSLREADPEGGVADRIDAEFVAFGVGVAADPAGAAKTKEDLQRIMGSLSEWETGRSFLNFSDPDVTGEECFNADSIEALKAIRAEYDPESLFVPPVPISD